MINTFRMTKLFDTLFEKVLSEVLIGSAKRNKMKRESSMDKILPHPRSVKKGWGQLKRRTIGQANKNKTGKISKDPRSKNVYDTEHVSKREFRRVGKTNYDGGYADHITNLNHRVRGEKLNKLKD